MIGTPPNCRPQCVVDSECDLSQACQNQRCVDVCLGACGVNSDCRAVNHRPTCVCLDRYYGDPLVRCNPVIEREPTPPVNPCQPSPCGDHAECRVIGDYHACSCLPDMKGTPPNCRPECLVNQECPQDKACSRNKCIDPCPGSCGINAQCTTRYHSPVCSCIEGYTGDPFRACERVIGKYYNYLSLLCYKTLSLCASKVLFDKIMALKLIAIFQISKIT